MLVRFSVENYLSFKDKTEFNMLTGNPRRLPHHVYKHGDLELLKMAAIYGANGAGKSNLIEALTDFRNYVTSSNQLIISIISNKKKFKLDALKRNQPISFEIEFITEGKMFFYALSIDEAIIKNEKLLLVQTNGKDELVFERSNVNNKIQIDFNPKYKETEQDRLRIKLYEEELLKDYETLLLKLSEAREGFSIVKEAINWFSLIASIKPNFSISNLIFVNDSIHDFIKDYIQKFNTGVNDFAIITNTFDEYFGENHQDIKERLKAELKAKPIFDLSKLYGGNENPKSKTIATVENNQYVIKRLITYHLDGEGNKIVFEPSEESDGSIRLWDILAAIHFVMTQPRIVLIDEIERSIHPYLLKQLLTKLSENKEIKGQLVFTTHESNLLDQEIFRQDEIWFAEKNTEGATQLYPMSDFDIRYDLDIRKGYLNGRFGAIPFLGDFKDLNWKADAE